VSPEFLQPRFLLTASPNKPNRALPFLFKNSMCRPSRHLPPNPLAALIFMADRRDEFHGPAET